MDPKEKQKLLVLFGIFGVAALIIYYNLLLKPQFSNFIAANRKYYTLRTAIKDADNLIINKDKIKKQYEGLSKEVRVLESRLAKQDRISVLLEDFSSVAESSGVKILRIKPLEAFNDTSKSESGLYSEFPILIEAVAGYHQCGKFINELENMDRFIRIDEINIRHISGEPRHHHIKLRVSTYIVK